MRLVSIGFLNPVTIIERSVDGPMSEDTPECSVSVLFVNEQVSFDESTTNGEQTTPPWKKGSYKAT